MREETGLDAEKYALTDWNLQNEFEIYEEWRYRYAPGVTRNTEHVFGLELPKPLPVTGAPGAFEFPVAALREAAEKVFSWTNAAALEKLPEILKAV